MRKILKLALLVAGVFCLTGCTVYEGRVYESREYWYRPSNTVMIVENHRFLDTPRREVIIVTSRPDPYQAYYYRRCR